MIGKILGYTIAESKGIISAEDGNRYEFHNEEWKSDKAPKIGQTVDFIIEDKQAKGIYLTSGGSFDGDEALETAKEKFNEIKNSEAFSNVMTKKDEILKKGVQYKYGFTLTILFILAYFLPVIEMPFSGNYSMWDGDLGAYMIFVLLILGFLFYSGGQALYIRIATAIVMLMLFLQYYDLLTGLRDMDSFMGMGRRYSSSAFSLLRFGNLILIPLALLLAFAGIFKKEKKQ
jgi:hypothetical protein